MEDDIEKLAKTRVQARMGFVVHSAMYVVLNAGLILLWFITGRGYPWFVWPLLGWGIGIVAHAVTLVVGPGSAAEQRAIERETARLRSVAH